MWRSARTPSAPTSAAGSTGSPSARRRAPTTGSRSSSGSSPSSVGYVSRTSPPSTSTVCTATSEALGLQWRDVDLDAATVFIHRNLTVANGRAMVNETKTAHGRRKIALDPATVTVLRRHRRHQLEEKLAADVAWEEHDLVFCGFDGRPIHPKQPTRWFREHIHVAGLPAIRLHDVRHTYASIAVWRPACRSPSSPDGSAMRPSRSPWTSTATAYRLTTRQRRQRSRPPSSASPADLPRRSVVTPWSRRDAESRERTLRARLQAVQVAGGQGIEP